MPRGIPPLSAVALHDVREHLSGDREAESFLRDLRSIVHRCEARHGAGTPECAAAEWNLISHKLLTPCTPWPLHELLYHSAFATWDETTLGPPPVWLPPPGQAIETNIGLLLLDHGERLLGPGRWTASTDPAAVFADLQRLSYDSPEVYWKAIIDELGIIFHTPPNQIADFSLSPSKGPYGPTGHWFPGARLNIAESCLDAGPRGKRNLSRPAIVWRTEGPEDESGVLHQWSLSQVRLRSRQVAAGLSSLGIGPGSAVAVYIPMTPDAVCIYLGILLAGAAVVSVAESFSAPELAARLRIAKADTVVTQDSMMRGGKPLPLYARVVEADAPRAIVVQAGPTPPQLRFGDVHFEQLLEKGRISEPSFKAPALSADATCNVCFSSGTTGTPKAILWTHVGPLKAAADAFVHQDVRPGDVVVWPTSLGWMMGPWLIFAALINGGAIGLYNGNPGSLGFLRFVQDARATMLGVIPSLVRAWKALSANGPTFDWSSLRAFSSTGEASTPHDALWLMSRAGYRAPVLEYCGGTEIGGAFVTGTLVQAQALSCFSTPAMGSRLVILDQHSQKPEPEATPCTGELALMPRMLGSSWKLLNADNFKVYFDGMPSFNGEVLRRHGDAFELLPRWYYRAHGRIDDTMNLGGIKVSSVEIERICNLSHPSVVETAAVGVPPKGGGPEELVVFAVLRKEERAEHLKAAFTVALRKKLNPLFKVSEVRVVAQLPRTATNKVLRRQLRAEFVGSRDGGSRSRL